MKIVSDIINKDKSLFIENKLKDICPKIFNENILLKFEESNIHILNTNYKKPAFVNISFLDKKVNLPHYINVLVDLLVMVLI